MMNLRYRRLKEDIIVLACGTECRRASNGKTITARNIIRIAQGLYFSLLFSREIGFGFYQNDDFI